MKEKELYKSIKKTVQRIDQELKKANDTGIFFAPELHVGFEIGKKILEDSVTIFGEKVIWEREIKLENKGIFDLYFHSDELKVVLELKLRNKLHAYIADINKLIALPSEYNKFYCVLFDTFSDKHDNRENNIENEFRNELCKVDHTSFKTWNNWYKNQIYCNLNLYKIN